MSYEPRIGPAGRDDEVTRFLRELYAAPAGLPYWEGLEARILARVRTEGDAWYAPYARWTRPGLVAAGIAVLLAGFALVRSRDVEARLAYETVIETPRALSAQLATGTGELSPREATLRYVITP